MKSIILIGIWIGLATCLFAQEAVIVKEVNATDKVVSVDVTKNDDGTRSFKIVTDNNGEKEVIEWTDEGEIPDDVKALLEENNINLHLNKEHDGENVFIEIEDDGIKKVRKEVIMIKKGDGGEVMELEWDGEGEMPAEMRELLDEHDIDIHKIHSGDEEKRVRIRKMKDHHIEMRNQAKKRGRAMNQAKKKKFKTITIDEDGNEKVMEWHGGREGHDRVKKLMDDEDVNVFKFESGHRDRAIRPHRMMFVEEDKKLSNGYMGAQIESDDNGARILDVMKDSPADDAGLSRGDIVQKINGARVKSMDDLLTILRFYEPNDEIELSILRDGNEKNIGLTLGERPESYK